MHSYLLVCTHTYTYICIHINIIHTGIHIHTTHTYNTYICVRVFHIHMHISYPTSTPHISNTYMHTFIHSCAYTQHMCIHTLYATCNKHTNISIHMCTILQRYIHISCTPQYQTHKYMHAYIHTPHHTHIHTCTQLPHMYVHNTYTNTCTQTHTCTQMLAHTSPIPTAT